MSEQTTTEETALDHIATDATIKPHDIPGVMNWLSARQTAYSSDQPLPLNDDPMLRYCLQLEERIAWQSREIESLRQMLNSEHSRHEETSGDRQKPTLRQRLQRLVFGAQGG